MFNNRKEALLSCMQTGQYTTYRLPDSDIPVSGCFWVENGELVHTDLEQVLQFNK